MLTFLRRKGLGNGLINLKLARKKEIQRFFCAS
jgi:hypothetical protein